MTQQTRFAQLCLVRLPALDYDLTLKKPLNSKLESKMRISIAMALSLALMAGTAAQAQNTTPTQTQTQPGQNTLGGLSPSTAAGIAGGLLVLGLIIGGGGDGIGDASTTTTTSR